MSKVLDITKSAAANEAAVNNKFEELSNQSPTPSGGGSSVNLRGTCEDLDVTWESGYIDANGVMHQEPSSSIKATEKITLTDKAGMYLFVPGYFDKRESDWFMYAKYNENNETVTVKHYSEWERPYLILPITSNNESYRINIRKVYSDYNSVYLVDRDWLISAGYADAWAGKKWLMYGDSYVYGHNIGTSNTWYNRFAFEHFVNYTSMGENGIGLVRSPNLNYGLCAKLEERLLDGNGDPLDLDVIGVCCGRNDSSTSVPIGTVDDMLELPDETNQYLHGDVTFMGGLNYICNWLLDNYAGKRIFFITPWNFLNNAGGTAATPIEYVDAMKTIAGKWGLPCFDAARQSGISVQHEGFRSMYFLSTSDVSHLNIAGHKFMSHGPVAGWLENLFRD